MKSLFCGLFKTGVIWCSGGLNNVHLKWDLLHNCMKYYRKMWKVLQCPSTMEPFSPFLYSYACLGFQKPLLPITASGLSIPLWNYPNLNMLFVFYWDLELGFWYWMAYVLEKCRQNPLARKKWKTRLRARSDINSSRNWTKCRWKRRAGRLSSWGT